MINFFESPNARLVGRCVNDQNWNSVLGLLDQFVLNWPGIALASHDVILQWRGAGLFVFREITGHLSKGILEENGLISIDLSTSPAAQWHSELRFDAAITDLKNWFDEQVKSTQAIDFPNEYGRLESSFLRQKVEFKSIDELALSWNFYALFERGSSSIFAF
tara:strand:+ start:27822 stop:28307 length:486 start_codon:yes stop_codon:yes gene_type:complete